MNEQAKAKLIATGVVLAVYGVAAIIDGVRQHKWNKAQRAYDAKFNEIVSNF